MHVRRAVSGGGKLQPGVLHSDCQTKLTTLFSHGPVDGRSLLFSQK